MPTYRQNANHYDGRKTYRRRRDKLIMLHHYPIVISRLRLLCWAGHCSMINMYGPQVYYINDIVSRASHHVEKSRLYSPGLDEMGHGE